MIACTLCFTEIEDYEDARNIGWEQRPSGAVCADCILEEERL